VFVAVPPARAFEVFTNDIDQWWLHGRAYRVAGRRPGRMIIQGGPGGRLYESFDLRSGPRTIEVGHITAWDPPRRFEMEWRGVNFKPDESTIVEVTFGPSGDGTLVTVRHRGWSSLRDGHPARHGLVGRDFSRMIGMWWGKLLTSLREHAVTLR
jgi:uncharacterized protein YndB with AHSA1/START domain